MPPRSPEARIVPRCILRIFFSEANMPHVIPPLLATGCARSVLVEGVEGALVALESVAVVCADDALEQGS